MAALEEQETTVVLSRVDSVVRVWTSDARHLRKLQKLESSVDSVRKVAGGDDWGEFHVDVEFFHLFSALRRKRVVSESERQARSERLAAVRELRRSARVDELLREREG